MSGADYRISLVPARVTSYAKKPRAFRMGFAVRFVLEA
jgi:hypothetical protein